MPFNLLKKLACSVDKAKQKLLDKMPYKPGVWLQKKKARDNILLQPNHEFAWFL